MADRERQRWLAVGAFAFHAFMNQFLFMNFAVITELAEDYFEIGDAEVNGFYTAAMLAAVPSFLVVMSLIDRYNWSITLVGTLFTVAAAWLRWLAVQQRSFGLGLSSFAALGPGTGLIFTGIAELPECFFGHGQKAEFARGIMTQAAFFGWGVGGLVAPMLITSSATMLNFAVVQAIVTSLCLPLFCCAYQPPDGPDRKEASAPDGGTGTTDWPNLLLTALACALLQAVGFTVPAIQEEISASMGFGPGLCPVFTFSFIMAGVLLGLLLASHFMAHVVGPRLVLGLFGAAAAALSLLHQLSAGGADAGSPAPPAGVTAGYFSLVVVVGGCSLGFVNVALPLVIQSGHPIPGKLTGGMVELCAFASASALTELSTGRGYFVCQAVALVAFALMAVSMLAGGRKPAAVADHRHGAQPERVGYGAVVAS